MSENLSRRRRILFTIAILMVPIATMICLLEVAAYIIIVVNGTNFYLPLELNELSDVVAQKRGKSNKFKFSQHLGWEPTYPNEYGYQGGEKDIKNAAIALFGDSYTEAYPIIEKSWPYLFEQQLHRPVLNFGVGGYGTDQAYLRFEKRFVGKLKTPYVALLVMSENIARVVNRYRGFYRRKQSHSLTKPRFYMDEDETVRLLPNPLATANEILLLGNMKFLQEIGAQDYWYKYFAQYDLNHLVHFPYSYYLLKALPYYIQRGYQNRIMNHREYEHLYQQDDATDILRFIILKFISRAKKTGSVPIIVFLPNWQDLVAYTHTGITIYHDFYHELKTNHYIHVYDALPYFIPHLDQGVGVPTFFRSRLDGHYSPEGERVIGTGFYRTLLSIDKEIGVLGLNN